MVGRWYRQTLVSPVAASAASREEVAAHEAADWHRCGQTQREQHRQGWLRGARLDRVPTRAVLHGAQNQLPAAELCSPTCPRK